MNRAERVLAVLRAQPRRWVLSDHLVAPGGKNAWRTATSEARALAKAHGGDVVNHQTRNAAGVVFSFYEYVPPVREPEPQTLWSRDQSVGDSL
jgi:hypothetical protein